VLVLALLGGAGATLGYGLGQGVGWVRDVWPEAQPQLVSHKVAPPLPDDGGPSRPCATTSVRLGVTTETTSVQAGDFVNFLVTITQTGRRPCVVDASDAKRQVVIADASGATVWSSSDCSDGEHELLLGPGEVYKRTVRWSGKRSAAGTCTDGQPEVHPGVYAVSVSLKDLPGTVSEPVPLTVLAPPTATPTPGGSATPTPGGSPTPTPGGSATPTPGGSATPPAAGRSTPRGTTPPEAVR
jgi:hypothetical protein